MRTPFRYPGAKNKMLHILMEHIGNVHKDVYPFCDAFVGGGSVALEVASTYPKSHIYLNDKDDWMYSFWSIVAGSNQDALQDLLNLIDQPVTIDLFYALREDTDEQLLKKAYKAIFFNRTAFSGILKSGPIGGKEQKSKYTVDCRYNAIKLKKKILACNKLLQGRTSVSNLDVIDFLASQDCDTTMYLDPPYYKQGQALYTEFMKPDEHVKLADMLKKISNKWLLSYDNCDEVLDLYDWAAVHFIDASYCIRGSKTNWQKTKEVLILPV